jgi:hypothetical protein
MTAIATLTEDFTGAAAGVAIATSNTIYDTVVGTASNLFDASGPPGGVAKSQRIVCGGSSSFNTANFPAVSAAYISFYLYVEALPTANLVVANWYTVDTSLGGVKIGDFRVMTDGTLTIRDNVTTRFTSTAIAVGTWNRIELKCDPGEATGHLLNVWSSGNLHGTATPSQTSGGVTATSAGVASAGQVSQWKFGALTNDTTAIVRIARIRGDNAVFPSPIVSSNIPPVANAGPNQTAASGTTVTLSGSATDSDGTIASYSWSQTSGPTVTLNGTGATRTFTAPATATSLTFQLLVTDNGGATSTDDVVITVTSTDTSIPALTEDFDLAASGSNISTANTIYDAITGTGTINQFFASAPAGAAVSVQSQRIVAQAGQVINTADFLAVSDLNFQFYLYIEASSSITVPIVSWFSGATKVGDLRLGADNSIQIRDNNTARWTSTPLTAGLWHRVEVRCTPGEAAGHVIQIWSGAKLNETTVPSQTSGPVTATASALPIGSTVGQVRLGMLSNDATAIIRFSRLRANSSTFPSPGTSTNLAPVANAGPNQLGVNGGDLIRLDGIASTDPDGTIDSYVWTQIAGPAVPLSGTGAARTFTAPSVTSSTTLTFQLTVTDNSGASASDTVAIGVSASLVTANAGADQLGVVPFSTVTLSGSGTGTITSYTWLQLSGPTVVLSGSGATRTFVAPGTVNGTILSFRLTTAIAAGTVATDEVSITVNNWNRFRVDAAGVRVPINHRRVN